MNSLLAELSAYYVGVYGSSDVRADEFTGPRDQLLTLDCEGEPAAIVGIRQRDSQTAELTRLWVTPGHRAHNHGRTIVARAIDCARRLGYTQLTTMTSTEHPRRNRPSRQPRPDAHGPLRRAR